MWRDAQLRYREEVVLKREGARLISKEGVSVSISGGQLLQNGLQLSTHTSDMMNVLVMVP